ncbi:MAG: lytic transglycosylase domain-containing protein [Kofleriaceae bacterium]
MRVGWIAVAVACAVGLSAAPPAGAQVYAHTDAEGVTYFTNIKPKGPGWTRLSGPERGSKAAADRGDCARCDRVPSRDSSPERFHRYDAFIREACDLYRIPVALVRAVIKSESDYDPRVVSAFDARGLMQLMPDEVVTHGLTDVHDPRQNILGGTRLLRMLANRYDGDLVLTLAGYHGGVGAVKRYGNTVPPFPNTRKYIKTVLDRYYAYRAEEAAGGQLLRDR